MRPTFLHHCTYNHGYEKMNYRNLVLLIAIGFMVLSNQEVAADHNTYTGGKDLPHGIDYNKLSESKMQLVDNI